MKFYQSISAFFLLLLTSLSIKAQSSVQPTIEATITYTSVSDTLGAKTINLGDEIEEEAPLTIECKVNLVGDESWMSEIVWTVNELVGERPTVLYNRLLEGGEKSTSFTFKQAGRFTIVLSMKLFQQGQDPDEAFKVDSTLITIKPSDFKCYNAFSPNGDGTNDYLCVECSSITQLNAMIFNRWGQRVAKCDFEQAQSHPETKHENGKNTYVIWDGMIGGRPAKDGVYFLNIQAEGADGQTYKFKKTVSVVKGYRDSEETDGSANQ